MARRIAVVTGASSGMGAEFARQISRTGEVGEVWLIARREEALRKVAESVSVPCRIVCADLSDRSGIESVAKLLVEESPDVRYLVNAAGFGKFGSWDTIGRNDECAMIDLNCRAVVDMTGAVLPYMGENSHLIQLDSASAFTPLPHMNVYAATKAFVQAYTRGLRFELKGRKIAVTAVCPAWVKTGFEATARASGASNDVKSLPFAQTAETVVSRALLANKVNLAVATCGVPAFALRVAGKLLPHWLTMAGWDLIRRL